MSKDFVEFPWRSSFEHPVQTTDSAESNFQENKFTDVKNFILKNKFIIGCLLGVLLLSLLLKKQTEPAINKTVSQNSSQISVVVPVVAFPKGSIIEPRLLKPVITSAKSFTKVQLFGVFTEEDIERVDDKLIAKKDLAPYRPIFWNSLELKRLPSRAPKQVQILYPHTESPSQ